MGLLYGFSVVVHWVVQTLWDLCVFGVYMAVSLSSTLLLTLLNNVSFSSKFPYNIPDLGFAKTVYARLDWKLEFKKL